MSQCLVTTTVYRVPLALDENRLIELEALLSPDERARADRFVVPEPRRQFIGCRAALRTLLAEHFHRPPREIEFRTGKWGKPSSHHLLQDQSQLHFNVSHSGNCGLIAISGYPIGVDLEATQPRIHVRSLARMVLSPAEQIAWNSLPADQHQEQILRLWVCKEALLKALGLGIAECLQQVSIPLPIRSGDRFKPIELDPAIQVHLEETADCTRNNWTDASTWTLQTFPIEPDHFGAVALLHPIQTVEMKNYP